MNLSQASGMGCLEGGCRRLLSQGSMARTGGEYNEHGPLGKTVGHASDCGTWTSYTSMDSRTGPDSSPVINAGTTLEATKPERYLGTPHSPLNLGTILERLD